MEFCKKTCFSAMWHVGHNLSTFFWTHGKTLRFFFFFPFPPNMKMKSNLEFKWIPEMKSWSRKEKKIQVKSALSLYFFHLKGLSFLIKVCVKLKFIKWYQ